MRLRPSGTSGSKTGTCTADGMPSPPPTSAMPQCPCSSSLPKCWLHRQANFITGFFPETAVAGVDYDFFYLPPIDDAYGKPFLIAGDIYAMFNDTPQARALMEYFTLPQSVSGFLEQWRGDGCPTDRY